MHIKHQLLLWSLTHRSWVTARSHKVDVDRPTHWTRCGQTSWTVISLNTYGDFRCFYCIWLLYKGGQFTSTLPAHQPCHRLNLMNVTLHKTWILELLKFTSTFFAKSNNLQLKQSQIPWHSVDGSWFMTHGHQIESIPGCSAPRHPRCLGLALTSKDGQFMGMLTPWLLLHHFRSFS